MLKRVTFCTLFSVFVMLCPLASPALTWGVCGHYGHKQHWDDIETQFSLMNQYGLKTYRFDLTLSDHKPDAFERLQRLVISARRHHITLHPILHAPFGGDDKTDGGKYPMTEAGLEAQGYNRVYPLVLQFAADVQDWELENELGLRKGFKKGIGHNADDFKTPLAYQWSAVLRGMSRAIRDVAIKTHLPQRVVFDITYVDFGLIPFLERNGVSIDKVAYHYYYVGQVSPYKISAPDGIEDIFLSMKKLRKPVIINEFNAAEIYAPKNQKKTYDDAAALRSLKTHIEYIINQKEANIEGVEFYELYNEPEKDVAESNFGLMQDPTHARTQMLLAAVYACGSLSLQEAQQLIASGLFDKAGLIRQLTTCRH